MSNAPARSAWDAIVGYFHDFKVLKETPREYWGVQLINFLDCAAYFTLLTVITLFLSDEIGFDDTHAGYVVTVFTATTTVFLLISGLITDWLGIRLSIVIALVGRMIFTLAIGAMALAGPFPHRGFVVGALLFLLAPFMAMIQTVFQSANRRYTTEKSRGAGFNLWYLFMNIGAAASGVLIDVLHLTFHLSTTWAIMTGVVTSFLGLLIALLMIRHEKQVYGADEIPVNTPKKDPASPRKSPWLVFKEMVGASAFWRFVVLITLLIGVRAVFTYMSLLLPKYWMRVIGPDAPIGLFNTINPILIVVGLILFIPLAGKFDVFKMLVYGAMISALSLFVFVIPWQMLHTDFIYAHYIMSILSMVLLSIGEVIWSPKLSEYTAAIAPEGQEGSYLGLSALPWLLANTVVSGLSGHMLNRWVPEGIGTSLKNGTVGFWSSPAAMWVILGLAALVGPFVALAFRDWFTKDARWKTVDNTGQPQEDTLVIVEPAPSI